MPPAHRLLQRTVTTLPLSHAGCTLYYKVSPYCVRMRFHCSHLLSPASVILFSSYWSTCYCYFSGMATAGSVWHSTAPPDLAELMRSIVQFASEHQWVYDVQMTRFFELRWWEEIPKEVGYQCCFKCEWHCGITCQITKLMIVRAHDTYHKNASNN